MSRSNYFFTTDESLMKVAGVSSKILSVIVIATTVEKYINHSTCIFNTYNVRKEHMVKTTPKDYFSKHPNALTVNKKWGEVNGRQ